MVKHSAFCAQYKKLLGGNALSLMKLPSKIDADWLADTWSDETKAHVDRTLGYLGAAASLLNERGVSMLVTGVPHYPQYTGEWSSKPHQALAEGARREGYVHFDSYEALAPLVKGSEVGKYYWKEDPTHFNAAGNRIWADAHVKALKRILDGMVDGGAGAAAARAADEGRNAAFR